MSRILLADDSPHAQRMGERILREEGFEVVSLTDGETSLLRLADVDPDLILADVFLPGKSGIDICRYVKSDPRLRHVRVVLTAGLLEPFDEEEARRAGCDAILKKPFEASKVMETIHPLVKEAQLARGLSARLEIDAERVQAAVTLALDAALPTLVHEITERVLIALGK
jgi:CheY-like chemotaxis protein